MRCAWIAAAFATLLFAAPGTSGALDPSSAPDPASIRYELGRRLRAFEVAFDSCVDPVCRKVVARHLQDATMAFFGLRLQEAGRSLDLARLRAGGEDIPRPRLWAASLAIECGRRALDLGAKGLPVRIYSFYEAREEKPDGARLHIALERTDGEAAPGGPGDARGDPPGDGGAKRPLVEISAPLDSVPLELQIPLDGLGEGDHALVVEVLAGGACLDLQRIGISLLRDLERRLDLLRSGLGNLGEGAGGSQGESIRGLVSIVAELASKPAAETDYPAARLLMEAEEALRVLSKGQPFLGFARPGEYWVRLEAGGAIVPARVRVPRYESLAPAPLVLALHGMGGSENLFFDGYGHGAIARLCAERGWLLAAPRSGLLGGVPVLELIDEIARLYPVDARRVFLVGHSMGAMQSIRAAGEAPARFAAVAALGGAASPRDPAAFKVLPTFIGVGQRDFALGGARRLRSSFERAGAGKVLMREYPEVEHLAIVQVALPDVFRFFDEVSSRIEEPGRGQALPASSEKGKGASDPQDARRPWYSRSLVGMEVGPTGAQFGHSDVKDSRYCARFDGRGIVRRCVGARCEYLVIWARDGDYAYYDSKLLPKAPGLGDRDPLREAVEEARRHELPLIAYCVVQQGGHFLDAHPEFAMRGPDGNIIAGRFCYNSGYLEPMKQILAEQLAYGIEGFHIDMLDQGFGPPYGCWCGACRQQFEAEFGAPMPKGVTWDDDWDRMLEFRYRSSERFEKALYAHVKALDARATVDFNYHGNPPFSFEVGQRPVEHAGNADFVTGETGAWGFSALGVGLNAEFYRAATPGRPFQVAMQRGVRMYHDQTTRPLNDIRWEILTLLAHGAFVTCVDKTGLDGSLDPVAYDRIGAAFADALSRRRHFGQEPVADVGIYFSSRSRDWIGREDPGQYFLSFQGAHKAMVYDHVPWGVVLDENVSLDVLRRFPVVLLPNVGILRDAEVELLRRHVEGGGKVILTGLSGCHDFKGRVGTSSSLEALSGARFVRKLDSLDNWVRLDPECPAALRGSTAAGWPFLVKGPAAVLAPTTAKAAGELLAPHRTVRQREGKEGTEWPMSPDVPVGPAILVNHIGEGTVLTFACSPDHATASEHHIVEARRLLTGAVRLLHPEPRVRISAPATVEAVITDEPGSRTLRVHLLGYSSPPQTTAPRSRPYVLPGLIEDPPMYRATIDLGRDMTGARAFGKETVLRADGRRVEATVQDVHEVIAITY